MTNTISDPDEDQPLWRWARRSFSVFPQRRWLPRRTGVRCCDVFVYREPRWWVFEIPELAIMGQAKRRADVPYVARELIALMLDRPITAVAPPRIHPRLGPSFR